MRRLMWILAAGLFFLNPTFACGINDPEFRYGATEMRAAVEGNWSFAITSPQMPSPKNVVVRLQQDTKAQESASRSLRGTLIRSAHACGTRTLINTAAACIDLTQMPLAVTFISGDDDFRDANMTGSFRVNGLVFGTGELDPRIGDYAIHGQVGTDGTVSNLRASLGTAAAVQIEGAHER